MKKKLVVLTGAGMSAESGIPTFRASDGLWENHRVEDVASPEGWAKDKVLVLDFYNQRRKKIAESQPNQGHLILADLQNYFEVQIVTQNIDDLHERAGSKHVIHLHGNITIGKSSDADRHYQHIGYEDINLGDKAEDGSQLRPQIVWFGEAVPLIETAIEIVKTADVIIVVGTSFQVYPAAGLINYAPKFCPIYVVDPKPNKDIAKSNLIFIEKGASLGLETVKQEILK